MKFIPGVFAAIFAVVALAGAASADQVCPDPKFTVRSAEAKIAARACTVASSFVASLESCGLTLMRPVTIKVTDRIDPDNPHCAARYNCESGTLTVLSPELLQGMQDMDIPFAGIPTLEFFDSLIAHELTHGLLHDNAPGMISRVAHEYLAHAMQLRALPGESRDAFLSQSTVDDPATASINMMVLHFVPAHFAAASWQFFESHEDSCAAVQQVLDRKTPFIEY